MRDFLCIYSGGIYRGFFFCVDVSERGFFQIFKTSFFGSAVWANFCLLFFY
jgi:hypothetical protein